MAGLSLATTTQTCYPNGRTLGQETPVPTAWHCYKNTVLSMRQNHTQRRCRTGKNIPQDAALDTHKLHKIKVSATSQSSIEQFQPSLGLQYDTEELPRGHSYLFRTEIGGLVEVSVGSDNMKYAVHIEVSSLPQASYEHDLILGWGMFRSDCSHLYVPDSQTSESDISQSMPEVGCGFIKTPFVQNSLGVHTVTLEFDSSQIPFYLSFSLYSSDASATGTEIRTHRKTSFCVPVGIGRGNPMPFGVSMSKDGMTNFSLFSRNAESVVLCLYDSKSNQPSLEIELDQYVNRTGDVWHVSMESIENYVSYGYRCKGEVLCDKGNRFLACPIVLDPYAKSVGKFIPNFPDQRESMSMAKCLGSLYKEHSFDWNGDIHPQLPMEKLVVYRLNVGQFTRDESSGLPENVAGTFAAVAEKLQHLISLGVNAVLLEPVFSFDEQRGPYFPYHFFSPMNSHGSTDDGMSAINSLKEMVKTLHAHGIEVLLEVVFTHTSEGGDADCQTISFRGIDNSSYYIVDNMGSGTNNALKCNNPIVQQMILDSLRHWLTEFHVDGFCFINSSSLLRGSNGDHLSRPPLVEAIAFDPLLSKTKIIADCWSPIDVSYENACFPHWKRWAEMNMRFCRDVRTFLGGEGLLSNLATRLCGSGDLFSDSRGPAFSFNYVTKNFGLPLVDLVSFSSSELVSELSWNCGVEGPTNNTSVLETRLRQIRNFLFVLFVSLGVPVLNMGDEFGHSTAGSPSYKDREPIDWNVQGTVFGTQVTQFIAFLSSLRKQRSDLFQRKDFWKVENIEWQGSNHSKPKWEEPSSKFLAMTLRAEDKISTLDKGDLFISFNSSDFLESAILPQLPEGNIWLRLVDTALPFPGFFSSDSDPNVHKIEALSAYELKPHSCALFESARIDN